MIETSGLTKRFDDILAVDHISAKIRDGSVFGLIGTNRCRKKYISAHGQRNLKTGRGRGADRR